MTFTCASPFPAARGLAALPTRLFTNETPRSLPDISQERRCCGNQPKGETRVALGKKARFASSGRFLRARRRGRPRQTDGTQQRGGRARPPGSRASPVRNVCSNCNRAQSPGGGTRFCASSANGRAEARPSRSLRTSPERCLRARRSPCRRRSDGPGTQLRSWRGPGEKQAEKSGFFLFSKDRAQQAAGEGRGRENQAKGETRVAVGKRARTEDSEEDSKRSLRLGPASIVNQTGRPSARAAQTARMAVRVPGRK